MTYDAFISYRRSDRITADGVARFLDAFGLKVFVDRSSRRNRLGAGASSRAGERQGARRLVVPQRRSVGLGRTRVA